MFCYIVSTLKHYKKSYLLLIIAVALATAVIFGALCLGGSVKGSLRLLAEQKVGHIDYVFHGGDRYFTTQLEEGVETSGELLGATVMQLPGIAVNQQSGVTLNTVTINGISNDFWGLMVKDPVISLSGNSIAINKMFASRLSLKIGDQLLIKIDQPGFLPKDAPLSKGNAEIIALQVVVMAILDNEEGGIFGLNTNQLPESIVYIDHAWLTQKVNLIAKGNLLLISDQYKKGLPYIEKKLSNAFTISDAGITVKQLLNQNALVADRVFFDRQVVSHIADGNCQQILSYFVNGITANGQTTPYSIVSSFSENRIDQHDIGRDEIVISEWLSKDLGVKIGDTVTIAYYVMAEMRTLIEKEVSLQVKYIYNNTHSFIDTTLMPNFPGISEAESCRHWDPAFPIDLEKIRDKDELYWDTFRGTPKAMIHFSTAQELWGNRFGQVTEMRFKREIEGDVYSNHQLKNLSPSAIGMALSEFKARHLNSVNQGLDLGIYFLCFSFFLIISTFILILLLFRLLMDSRISQFGTLLSIGLPQKLIMRAVIIEITFVSTIGGVIGLGVGILYTKCLLYIMTMFWPAVSGLHNIEMFITKQHLIISVASGVAISCIAVYFSLRKIFSIQLSLMLKGGKDLFASLKKTKLSWSIISVICCIALAFGVILFLNIKEKYFIVGFITLIGLLSALKELVLCCAHSNSKNGLSIKSLVFNNVAMQLSKKMAVVVMLAIGSFMVISVVAFHQTLTVDTSQRHSGSGGFAFYGQSSLGIFNDLNDKAVKDDFGLAGALLANVQFVPLRVRQGDDASCLNLNRAQNVKVVAVNPAQLVERNAFRFSALTQETASPWSLLDTDYDDNTIAAIGDMNTLMYGLHKGVGDEVVYVDERGETLTLKIVGMLKRSVLQGCLVISEKNFVTHFPSISGYQEFLIDAKLDNMDKVASQLSYGLSDAGFEIVSTATRLALFNSVENTYLSIFQALGFLGVLLGAVGMSIVFYRNMIDRQHEFSMLRALGFEIPLITKIVFLEYWAICLIAIVIGVVASVIALVNMVFTSFSEFPMFKIAMMVALLMVSTSLFIWITTKVALSTKMIHLRNE